MSLPSDEFYRLEGLIYRPVSTRPDWLKAWRNEAQYLSRSPAAPTPMTTRNASKNLRMKPTRWQTLSKPGSDTKD